MKKQTNTQWTQNERNLLKKIYKKSTEEELLKAFPGRSINAIRKQVHYLRKRGWTF